MPPEHTFRVNGEQVTVTIAGEVRLLWVLRDILGITGPKYGCGIKVCGACTSFIDGKPFNPCVTKVSTVVNRKITTIEGVADGARLHPVQEAWLEQDVAQCGYCQPGQIMSAIALLDRMRREGRTDPTDAEIDEIDNVCRCGTYFPIREAIKSAAVKMRARGM